MLIRPASLDEIGRAQSLLNGHPVLQEARSLGGVEEQPVERIIALHQAAFQNSPENFPKFISRLAITSMSVLCSLLPRDGASCARTP
ncbi:MAG: hypothetical protein P8H96_05300 [Akkermansiaceae bacterium]|nr:hypothetical protein [Akkermansiaceae bacterium]